MFLNGLFLCEKLSGRESGFTRDVSFFSGHRRRWIGRFRLNCPVGRFRKSIEGETSVAAYPGVETRNQLKVPKWPFMVADVILIVCAALVYVFGGDDLGPGGGALIVLFLFLGAVAILIPFVVEFLWQWQLEVAAREEVQQQRLLQVEMKAREPMAALLERLESAISAMPEGGSGERIEEVLREVAAQKDSLQKIAGEFEKIREKGESEQPEVVAAYSLISRLETVAEKFEEMLSAADGKVEMEEESP